MPPQRRNEIQLFYNTTFYVIVGITFLHQTILSTKTITTPQLTHYALPKIYQSIVE